VYRASQGSRDSNPDVLFSQATLAIQESVLDGADVKTTAFFGAKTSLNKHGQHAKGAKGFGHLDHTAAPASTTQKRDQILARFDFRPGSVSSPITQGDDECYSFSMVEAEIQSKFQTSSQVLGQKKSSSNTHHSPLPPDLYVKYRIEPALLFYEGRIPSYSKVRSNGQAILIIGSVCGVVLVTFDRTVWAAAVSIITGSVTAWLEFNGVSSKVNRYSSAAHGLTTLALWWRTLDSIDKSLVGNVDKLVSEGEGIIKGESEAWASATSRTTSKMLNEATKGTKGD